MAHFSLSLLGAYQAVLDGEPITRFRSTKARALLAYLAIESDRLHSREALAALLWPDQPERVAGQNLRNALYEARKSIGDRNASVPVLLVTSETLQINQQADIWVDAWRFEGLTQPRGGLDATIEQLVEALALYRGEFLEGFSVAESARFDDWALLVRERLAREAVKAAQELTRAYAARGEVEPACESAWREVKLDPWSEDAYQHLMAMLALSGQRTAALAQYEACRDMLAREFGVDPSPGMEDLHEQIRDGKMSAGPAIPARSSRQTAGDQRPLFVAREEELVQLGQHLFAALSGEGRVVFVIGEAGQGKTALVRAFAERAQRQHPRLLVASGSCSAYTGVGDPYLPFREILATFVDDIDAQVAIEAIGQEQKNRLLGAFPAVSEALAADGPDLVDVFVSSSQVARRVAAYQGRAADRLTALKALLRRKTESPGPTVTSQEDLFAQVTTVLRRIAGWGPLLLFVDDLQWIDPGSLGLLFHLGKHLEGAQVLVIGAYRPEDVALGGDGQRHPLVSAVSEFGRMWGDIGIDLGKASGEHFVDALLDSEPNTLSDEFRSTLYHRTTGHPLFTLETLAGMQARGDLVRDADGRWTEGPTLDWRTLPARVEAVIAERVGRLPELQRQILRVASVEGQDFTAESVAYILGIDNAAMLALLSGDLAKAHRLVSALGIRRLSGHRTSSYRFRHILFQNYLYDSLDAVERVLLHEQVGGALEELYGASEEALIAISPQLARHFEISGIADKAVR